MDFIDVSNDELMQEAPDEETRKEFKRFMSKLSDMWYIQGGLLLVAGRFFS